MFRRCQPTLGLPRTLGRCPPSLSLALYTQNHSLSNVGPTLRNQEVSDQPGITQLQAARRPDWSACQGVRGSPLKPPKSTAVTANLLGALGLTALLLAGCNGRNAKPSGSLGNGAGQKPKVTMGIQMSPAMALVMVAKDKGCFDEAGVDVELKGFTAGKFALQSFLGGSLDFAVAGEVPTTLATIQGNKLAVVSQVVDRTIKEVRVVARRDGSLTDPKAYFHAKKRRLATSIGGGPEFFTYNFLKKHSIGPAQVTIVSQQPGDMPASVVGGSVDAIAIFDPFAYIAEQKLGATGVTFADPDLYSELYVLVVKPSDVANRRQIVDSVLRGLVKAEALIRQDPAGAKQIVVNYTKLDRAVVDGIWGNFVYAPALNKQLVSYMTAQAAWAKEKGDMPRTAAVPDFRREVINSEPLKTIRPEAVQLD